MADYLEVRRALMGVVLMVDSRHGFTPLDLQLMDFIAQRVKTGEIKLLVLLTKCRQARPARPGPGRRPRRRRCWATSSPRRPTSRVTLFSSMRRVGVEDVAEQLLAWKKAMPERVHFDVPPMPEGEGGDRRMRGDDGDGRTKA